MKAYLKSDSISKYCIIKHEEFQYIEQQELSILQSWYIQA